MNNSYYNLLSNYMTPSPKTVQGLNNSAYFYYRTQLYLKIYSLFDFENLPENWDIDYIKDNLFRDGYITVVEHNGTVWRLTGGLTGVNVYNNPTDIIIANPVLGSFNKKIGVDGEILYFNRVDGAYVGLENLVTRYAIMLANCDGSINTTLINSRVAHVFEGENDAEIQSYKKLYDEVSQGKPAVFLKKGKATLTESNFNFLNVKNTYIGNDIMLTKNSIMNEFLTEIGISNANRDKRERLTDDEVNSNNAETCANVMLWLDSMQRCCEKINNLFGLNIGVKLKSHVTTGTEKKRQGGEGDEFYQFN